MEIKESNIDKESVEGDCDRERNKKDNYYESIKSQCNTGSAKNKCSRKRIGSQYCEDNYDSKLWKKKTIVKDDHQIVLRLYIFHAEGIDSHRINPSITHSTYKVEAWVDIGTLCMTEEVYGLPNPEWNEVFHIPLENPMNFRFLYVEVIRTCSKIDPGTSTGEALVGKVRVPLPEILTRIEGCFELVRPEGPGCRAEGHIVLAMELIKIQKSITSLLIC